VNIFVRMVRLSDFQFQKVKYFSVHFQNNEVNEFFDFLNRMEDLEEMAEDLSYLLVWIEEIGENYGAIKNRFFRNESILTDVQALPPPKKQMDIFEIPVQNLRLYCMVLNEHVEILFNGGIKTKNNARDCPNVRPYIMRANQLAVRIDELIEDHEITWNKDFTDISFDENLEFEI